MHSHLSLTGEHHLKFHSEIEIQINIWVFTPLLITATILKAETLTNVYSTYANTCQCIFKCFYLFDFFGVEFVVLQNEGVV